MADKPRWLRRLQRNRRVKTEIGYREFYSGHLHGQDHKIQDMLYVLDVLDVKAGPLLTFIGLVLTSFSAFAALQGAALIGSGNLIVIGLVGIVIVMLAIAAFLALSCVYVIGPNSHAFQRYINEAKNLEKEDREEVVLVLLADAASKRRIRYLTAFRFAFIALTLFFLLIGATMYYN